MLALLFALHPMHVESVAWAVERKDVLFFILLSGQLAGLPALPAKRKIHLACFHCHPVFSFHDVKIHGDHLGGCPFPY